MDQCQWCGVRSDALTEHGYCNSECSNRDRENAKRVRGAKNEEKQSQRGQSEKKTKSGK